MNTSLVNQGSDQIINGIPMRSLDVVPVITNQMVQAIQQQCKYYKPIEINAKSITLLDLDIYDNELIKMYFNGLRKYEGSKYFPVQYLQYEGKLYSLVKDYDANFFKGNRMYPIANFDDKFGGLHVIWRLSFPDGKSHNNYRITATVSLMLKGRNASLDDITKCPTVNLSDWKGY